MDDIRLIQEALENLTDVTLSVKQLEAIGTALALSDYEVTEAFERLIETQHDASGYC